LRSAGRPQAGRAWEGEVEKVRTTPVAHANRIDVATGYATIGSTAKLDHFKTGRAAVIHM